MGNCDGGGGGIGNRGFSDLIGVFVLWCKISYRHDRITFLLGFYISFTMELITAMPKSSMLDLNDGRTNRQRGWGGKEGSLEGWNLFQESEI
jgi:hypothetical protein